MSTRQVAMCSVQLLYALLASVTFAEREPPLRAIVWGPGLRGDFTLPVRYIFIKIQNKNGNSLPEVSPSDLFVEFRDASSGSIKQFQADLLRTAEGNTSFLYRYRPHNSYPGNIVFNVFYKRQRLASETINGPIYSEECDCPSGTQRWLMDQARCPPISPQILTDLKPFPIIRPEYNRKVMQTFYDLPYSVSVCNYIIKQNRIYRKCMGEYVGFTMFVDAILTSLVRKVKLPDVDFIVNLGDYPLAKQDEQRYSPQIPILSWCGSEDTRDVVMPTYELVEASVHMMRRVALDIFSVQDRTSHPFESRLPSAFWRGRDSREERLQLVKLSQNEPHLLNASITNFFFFRDQMSKFGGKTPHVSFFNFFQHKYQVNVDGTVAAYRLPFLLAGGSTVFKTHPTPFYEHFYHLLEENVNFIGVRPDLSDLMDKIRFCLNNEKHCAQVARNGRQLVNDHLLPHLIYCYYVQLLLEFATRIEGPVEVPDGMKHVDHRQDSNCNCFSVARSSNHYRPLNRTSYRKEL
ncbi:KDEL motif-containing protein 1-like isoform X3 [Varroa jacobsoni]|uniref:Glycosyl transferase CAP10 domain-containing protein n=1 Tax=Varroa destructor TaxID=109461 RepID=A0A7M7JCS8_VARDE|nr:KDEL motif-containing protein 1-like isoform X3 [Varroa destructor]XP_022687532.1 KDEL motif-containing protein 1-like isoform X3 [Varroa jacobsoni]